MTTCISLGESCWSPHCQSCQGKIVVYKMHKQICSSLSLSLLETQQSDIRTAPLCYFEGLRTGHAHLVPVLT